MNELKLCFTQDYMGCWVVADENYDYCPDTGSSPIGRGKTKEEALLDYFYNAGFDAAVNYIMHDN